MKTIKKAKTKIKRYAFWKYDLFPYMLAGVISDRCKKTWPGTDHYTIESYGPGHYCKPFLIVRGEKGAKLKESIENLRAEYKSAKTDLYYNFKNRLREMNPKFKEII